MSYTDQAWATIDSVHAQLPRDATPAQRKTALWAAYPFGPRKYWPYKAWLKAQRAYLARYSDEPAGPLFARPADEVPRKVGVSS